VRTINFVTAINEALHQEMANDSRVILLGEDVARMGGDFGATMGLLAKFGPDRVRDTPLSEAAILGVANGAAFVGLRPIVEIMFSDFITECYDQLVNNSAKAHYMFEGKASAAIVVRTASGAGFRAAYHHSQNPEAWFQNIPGLTVVGPSTPYDAKGLLIAAIRDDNPVIFLEHKMLYGTTGEVPEESYTLPIGVAEVKRPGTDVTVVASLKQVHYALAAAEKLAAEEEISCEVIDLRTLIPFDQATVLASLKKTGRIVLVNEAPKTGSINSEISAVIMEEAFKDLKAPVERVNSLDVPVGFAPVIEDYVTPGPADIAKAVRKVIDN
jgi:pyruvate dehydrogenase E1 component beta subunit